MYVGASLRELARTRAHSNLREFAQNYGEVGYARIRADSARRFRPSARTLREFARIRAYSGRTKVQDVHRPSPASCSRQLLIATCSYTAHMIHHKKLASS
jgi:hypothetical protein